MAYAPESNLNKRAVFWNAAGSTMSALQSFVFLIAITRFLGTEVAGDYSIGAAIAQLMWIVGLFEQASYLVTDYKNRFSLEQYFAFKIISCVAMVVCSVVYVFSFGFSSSKATLALWLCAFKLVDAFFGYYYSVFQKCNRLDVSGRALFFQNASAIVVLIPLLLLGIELTIAIAITTLIMAAATFFIYHRSIKEIIPIGRPDFNASKLIEQFWQLLPLFLASFLYGYLANTPRYAIESVGTNTMQAYFNILFMPSFAISLCARFFLRPAITVLSDYWAKGETSRFIGLTFKLIFGVVGITIVLLVGSWLIGIPILSIIFGVDLDGTLSVLLILLFASGVMVVSDVLYYPIIIFRIQVGTLVAYAAAMIAGIAVANAFVLEMGLMGAAFVYLIEAIVVLFVFMVIVVYFVFTKKTG